MANELYRVDNGYGFGSSNGNIVAGNVLAVTATTVDITADIVELGSNANVKITGGSNGQSLTTDGSGNLSWTTVSSGGASNVIYQEFNGSNAQVFTAGANTGSDFLESGIAFTSALTSETYYPVYATLSVDVADYTTLSLRSGNVGIEASSSYGGTGYLYLDASNTMFFTSPNVYLGSVANITIDGGTEGQILSTDGFGMLSWVSGAPSVINVNSSVAIPEADGNIVITGNSTYEWTFDATSGNLYVPVAGSSILGRNGVTDDDANGATMGSEIRLQSGAGGNATTIAANSGGVVWVTGGTGGRANAINSIPAGMGGTLFINGGEGGSSDGTSALGGQGGAVYVSGGLGFGEGTGGEVKISSGPSDAGQSGNVTIEAAYTPSGGGNGTSNGAVKIVTSENKTWVFDQTGNFILPANTFDVKYANGTQVSLGGGGSSDNISNGTSNVSIASANSNVTVYVDSQLAATFVYSNGMAGVTIPTIVAEDLLFVNPNSTVEFSAASNVNLGDVNIVHITGGATGQLLSTDGAGILSWVNGAGTPTNIEISIPNGQSNLYTYGTSGGGQDSVGFETALTVSGNTYNVLGASLVSNAGVDLTTVGIKAGNVIIEGNSTYGGPGIVYLNSSNAVEVQAANVNLGPVANIHITGGNSGQFLKTDGTGNLSWSPLTLRVTSVTSSNRVEVDTDNTDQYNITALAENTTITLPIGTPTDGQKLMIRIRDDGTTREIIWGIGESGGFRAVGPTLPTTTTPNKLLYVGSIWNAADLRWDVVALSEEA